MGKKYDAEKEANASEAKKNLNAIHPFMLSLIHLSEPTRRSAIWECAVWF